MNLYDKILICVFLFAILVWQALHQVNLFNKQKTISHFWKGVWYALAVTAVTVPYISMNNWWYILKVPAIGLAERMAFFDFILNDAHKEPLFYNGPKVQLSNSKGSWVDRLENKLTNTQLAILKIGYVILFIVAVIFIK